AWSEQDHVMGNARPAALDPEVDDEQRRAEALAGEAPGHRPPARVGAEQVAVGVDYVGIAGDGVEPAAPAAARLDLARASRRGVDPHDRVVQPDLAAELLEVAHHAGDDTLGAAASPPHARVLFELVEQGV